MKITIATIESTAAVMYIANQRAAGFKKIEPFAKLAPDGRAAYRLQARAALRFLAPAIARAEKRAWSRGWDAHRDTT